MKTKGFNKIIILIILAVLVVLSLTAYFLVKTDTISFSKEPQQEQIVYSKYTNFLIEIFDKIQENYWKTTTDEEIVNLYKLATEKVLEKEVTLSASTRQDLAGMLELEISLKDTPDEKEETAAQIATIVLANLEPFGRSGLYTEEKEQELANMVQNVDPNTNLYNVLNVAPTASTQQIASAAGQLTGQLQQVVASPTATEQEKQQAEEDLRKVERAKETLTVESSKERYDKMGAESTVYGELLTPEILHLKLKRFSPQTFEEFQQIVANFDDGDRLNSLIFDLRDNIGGSIDLLQYFLGPFIGPNQYAFEFFHQDEHTPYKTLVGWLPGLVRYKKVVILINQNDQSSAELMASVLKKYNVGVLVGRTTKGWGTIERVFELENQISDKQKYSMFLVHTLTLKEDGQPIEGRGVDPLISIDDNDWKDQLSEYFSSYSLIREVEKLVETDRLTEE